MVSSDVLSASSNQLKRLRTKLYGCPLVLVYTLARSFWAVFVRVFNNIIIVVEVVVPPGPRRFHQTPVTGLRHHLDIGWWVAIVRSDCIGPRRCIVVDQAAEPAPGQEASGRFLVELQVLEHVDRSLV
jgi:hypothetical protein